MKARAWIDNKERRESGERIQSGDVVKHKNDIYKLSQLLNNNSLADVPEVIKSDISKFVEEIVDDDAFLRSIGIRDLSIYQIKEALLKVYCTGS